MKQACVIALALVIGFAMAFAMTWGLLTFSNGLAAAIPALVF